MGTAVGSSRFLQHALNSFGHTFQQLIRILNGASSRRSYFVMLFPFSATLRRRLTDARSDQSFDFEPLKRCVNRTHGSGAPAALLEFCLDSAAICFVSKTHGSDENELFKFAQIGGLSKMALHE